MVNGVLRGGGGLQRCGERDLPSERLDRQRRRRPSRRAARPGAAVQITVGVVTASPSAVRTITRPFAEPIDPDHRRPGAHLGARAAAARCVGVHHRGRPGESVRRGTRRRRRRRAVDVRAERGGLGGADDPAVHPHRVLQVDARLVPRHVDGRPGSGTGSRPAGSRCRRRSPRRTGGTRSGCERPVRCSTGRRTGRGRRRVACPTIRRPARRPPAARLPATPERASWYAVLVPITPPPMMTTDASAVRGRPADAAVHDRPSDLRRWRRVIGVVEVAGPAARSCRAGPPRWSVGSACTVAVPSGRAASWW